MSRLKIALLLNGSHDWIGGSEYFENLILALGNLPSHRRKFDIYVISDDELPVHLNPFVTKIYTRKDMLPIGFFERIKWKIIRYFSNDKNSFFESFLKKEKIDFLYPYTNLDNRTKPYRSSAWITDFQHKHLPDNFTSSELESRDEDFSNIARSAERVILSSKMAEADCHQFYPNSRGKTGVMSFRVVPLPEWYEGNPIETQKKYNLPDKFFIVSNQFWLHKNHFLIFKALQLMKDRSIFPTIICTGHIHDYRCPEYSDTVLSSIHKYDISQQVIILGLIPKTDQIQLIRRSIAIIQPSLFEGWSTIIENGRCLGKPIILSDFPVHKEQNPPNSMYFERNSAEQLAECIEKYWSTFPIGPDLEREKGAFLKQQEYVSDYGKSFLKINQLV